MHCGSSTTCLFLLCLLRGPKTAGPYGLVCLCAALIRPCLHSHISCVGTLHSLSLQKILIYWQFTNHLRCLSSFLSLSLVSYFSLAPCARLNWQYSVIFQEHIKSSLYRIVSYHHSIEIPSVLQHNCLCTSHNYKMYITMSGLFQLLTNVFQTFWHLLTNFQKPCSFICVLLRCVQQ